MSTTINRRDFLKGSVLGLGAVAVSSSVLAEASTKRHEKTRDFSLAFNYKSRFESDNSLKLWFPLAMSNDYQTPYNLKVNGNYSSHSLTTKNGAPMLQATWERDGNEKSLHATYELKVNFLDARLSLADPKAAIQEDRYIRTNSAIAHIAKTATRGIDGDTKKVEKLFAWVANNVSMKEGIDSQGIRSIRDINGAEIMRGDNLSASSVFVALCKEAGIPSLECFGLSLDEGRHGLNNPKPSIYTRSATYLNGAWIPNDVILAINARETIKDEARRRDVMESSLSQWDNNWVLLNHSRDIVLDSVMVSTLQQVYGEVDGVKLANYDLPHFSGQIVV